MLKILVVEGNSAQLVDQARAQGVATNAEQFSHTLASFNQNLHCEIFEPYRQREKLSVDYLAQFNGAVFTGSGVSWSTSDQQAAPQRQAMESVFKARLPAFGSCNGMQLAAVVLGGTSQAAAAGLEIGLAQNIQLTREGSKHPLHRNRENGFCCPCIHRDQVSTLPSGAVVTAENDHSIQGMVFESTGVNFWGVQYHPELGLSHIADYIRQFDGIFAGQKMLLAKIEDAMNQPATTESAMGAKIGELEPNTRGTELINWLQSL